jgi:hypothetical protein
MEYLIFFAILLFYIYRTFSQAQKNAKQEAERRRRANEQAPPAEMTTPQPKTLEDVLTEVFREVESKSKPYGDKRQIPPAMPQPKAEKKKASPVSEQWKKPVVKKKDPAPFLTTDYTEETVEPEGTPSTAMQDFIKKTQVSDAYAHAVKGTKPAKFNLREAVIAKIILDRPEW